MKTESKKGIIINLLNKTDWLNGSKVLTFQTIKKAGLNPDFDLQLIKKVLNNLDYSVRISSAVYIKKPKDFISTWDLQNIDKAKGI